jgi:hypothetical protein
MPFDGTDVTLNLFWRIERSRFRERCWNRFAARPHRGAFDACFGVGGASDAREAGVLVLAKFKERSWLVEPDGFFTDQHTTIGSQEAMSAFREKMTLT